MKSTIFFFVLVGTFFSSSVFAKKILILGDSLTAGYGVEKSKSYPAVLEKLLVEAGKKEVSILNGGISGSTTASGLSRLTWFLKAKPSLLIVALGANDGLRGVKVTSSKENLRKIIKLAKKNKLKVILAGMHVPPNYGKEYARDFHAMYKDLAKEEKVELIPFLLEGVAGKKELNIYDGIHPNEKGHLILAKSVFNKIKDLI